MLELDSFAKQALENGWEIKGYASVPEWDEYEQMPEDYPECPVCGKTGVDHCVWFQRENEETFFNQCYDCGTTWQDYDKR